MDTILLMEIETVLFVGALALLPLAWAFGRAMDTNIGRVTPSTQADEGTQKISTEELISMLR